MTLDRPQGDWSPFSDRVTFETAEQLFAKEQMSAMGIDTLMDLWRASFIQSDATNGGAPFVNHKDLYNTIDSISLGVVDWKSFTLSYSDVLPERGDPPSWMEDRFDVWYRDPHLVAKNMLSNTDFADNFDYLPFQEFDADGEQIWENFMSGTWAWTQAVCVFALLTLLAG